MTKEFELVKNGRQEFGMKLRVELSNHKNSTKTQFIVIINTNLNT